VASTTGDLPRAYKYGYKKIDGKGGVEDRSRLQIFSSVDAKDHGEVGIK
jgi:hypothetical protein